MKNMGDDERYNVSETGNWNVAAEYSKLKIMKPLFLCDIYQDIAKFGHHTILDQLENHGLSGDELRIEGYDRLVNELIKLCDNAHFACKVGKTREKLEEHTKRLEKALLIIPVLSKVIVNQRLGTKQLTIRKEPFGKALKEVLKIKKEINEPLNKNHLIFTDKETFDPIAYKEMIKKQATERG